MRIINRYLKVSLTWILIPTAIGTFIAFSAAGRGGASAIFLFFGLLIGLFGAIVHCFIISINYGSGRATAISSFCAITVLSYLTWASFRPIVCNFTEAYAVERLTEHVIWLKRDPENLSNIEFNKEGCSYSYIYQDTQGKYMHTLSNWGKVETWDYSRNE